MQDQYVGDIGDFGKYGLLRALSGDTLRMGVVWYLFPDESGRGDGKYIDYLNNPTAKDKKLRECDPELYNELHKITIMEENRSVVRVQEGGVLPRVKAYYYKSLSYNRDQERPSRESARRNWLEGALAAMSGADIVFVDPDNGITEKPIQYSKNGPKYVFMEDLREFYERGQSLIIYHHLARWDKADNQIRYFAGRLQERLNLPCTPWALRYRRGTTRVYFIVPQDSHRNTLESQLDSFKKSPWCKQGHFELVT